MNKILPLNDDDLRAMIDEKVRAASRPRSQPGSPGAAGYRAEPRRFFQAREACNPFYRACPTIVQNAMDRFAELTGRSYHLFDYVGAPDAERVIVLMGSGAGAAEETVESWQAGRKSRRC